MSEDLRSLIDDDVEEPRSMLKSSMDILLKSSIDVLLNEHVDADAADERTQKLPA